ncbi:CaiB/BaiF CoA transferase family protein [Rhodococcoides fascians]|uniref:CaiB/BaiF CoA transferase family protein n=1 Tax=Rhodococcoides fascians TaxID=1828 RepID=UPI00050CBAE7|nr:CoA transferase [Rhodococcus fascians]
MRPLEDVRIISLEQYGAGPFGSLHLADLGADVIKIEDPSVGGDVGRYVPPYNEGEDSLFFESFNRNKRSLSLDLSTPSGRAVFEDLVRTSDAVYSNLRGDVPEKIGITYDQLKHLNPAIVCCSLTGFGMTGPRAKEPGYDYILQGLAGWMSVTGDPDGPPTKSGLSLVDYSGGFVAAISLLSGLHAARRDGIGGDCDVSLYDTAMSLLTYPATWHLNAGFEPIRTKNSAHPSLVPFQAFEATDGWLIVGCAKEKFWDRLVVAIDRPDLGADARFTNFSLRGKNQDVLLPILEEVFATNTVDHWLSKLGPAGVPSGPINDVEHALTEPHTLARNLVVETEHPVYNTVRQVASPVNFGSEAKQYRRAPQRNEHFDDIVREQLGYDDERVAKLKAEGAFGTAKDEVRA